MGELASSALATATAVGALALGRQEGTLSKHGDDLVAAGRAWLARYRNPDGGWGDTVASASNVATTALVWGAFALARAEHEEEARAAAGAADWLRRAAGGLEPARLAAALAERYGKDRTFSAPILAYLAASGRLGAEGWRHLVPLPFELALVPPSWLGAVRLPVVSYALPALIAIGHLRHRRSPSRNPLVRAVRTRAAGPALGMLPALQPASGGFLEAVPLTSFVVLSLLASGERDHPVVGAGMRFLAGSARADGSWPIDSDLSTWVTTLSVAALGAGALPDEDRPRLRDWLLACRHRELHPYTRAAPGGWAWTDRSGGVPDADDTAGALVALSILGADDAASLEAATAGVGWLMGLQNRDGGLPTFCRGWGALPFDRSSPDLTAHAIRAWGAWQARLHAPLQRAVTRAIGRALRYLEQAQRPDGSWAPLWFGNERAPGERNPVYGTSRVLSALAAIHGAAREDEPRRYHLLARGRDWLLRAQNADGGWGGALGVPSSLEETGLAVSALAVSGAPGAEDRPIRRGVSWIVEQTDRGRHTPPSPIGLYFARLWYFETLYPLIFTVAALRSVEHPSP